MLTITDGDRLIANLDPSGSIVFGPEMLPIDAARALWTALGKTQYMIYSEDGVPLVRVRFDGGEVTFFGGQTLTPDVIDFWNAVAAQAPLREV